MSKNLKQQKGDGGDMEYKNNEGYPDPTAGKAIRAADRMPTHIYNVLPCIKCSCRVA